MSVCLLHVWSRSDTGKGTGRREVLRRYFVKADMRKRYSECGLKSSDRNVKHRQRTKGSFLYDALLRALSS